MGCPLNKILILIGLFYFSNVASFNVTRAFKFKGLYHGCYKRETGDLSIY